MDSFNSLIDDANLVYLYDGTLEGLLTSVFTAYARHEEPVNIVEADDLQESMLCSYIPTPTSISYASRVKNGIIKKLGDNYYESVKQVFLSDDAQKGGVIYRFIRYAIKTGRRSLAHLTQPEVADFVELRKQVGNEAHYMLQFVRFAHLENGVFYSHIEPKASIVPLITDHFARRLNVQPFIIYDSVHGLASVFDTKRWWLVDADEITVPEQSETEGDFQALWQTFYDTIAIEERCNPTCQRNFMPKRFWGNMCEHIPPELRKKRPQTATPTTVARLAANQKKQLTAGSDNASGHTAGHTAGHTTKHTAKHAARHTTGHTAGHTTENTARHTTENTTGHTARHTARQPITRFSEGQLPLQRSDLLE